MKRDEISFIVQLVRSLENVEIELETAYAQGDVAKFNRLKKFALQINQKISEVLR